MKAKYHSHPHEIIPQTISQGVKVNTDSSNSNSSSNNSSHPNSKVDNAPIETKPNCGSFTIKETFSTSVKELYSLFIDSQRLSMLTCSKVLIEPKVGGKVEMFNGAVSGEVKEIIENKKIVQNWRFNSWDSNQMSTVTMSFNAKDDRVEFILEHKNVPQPDLERTKAGWYENFVRRIPVMFGFVSSSSFL